MIKKNWLLYSAMPLLLVFCAAFFIYSKEQTPEELPPPEIDREQLSIVIAHGAWAQLKEYAPYYNLQTVIDTLQQLDAGSIPAMSAEQRAVTLTRLWEPVEKYESEVSLEEARCYLANIAEEEGIVELVPGKLYYRIMHAGTGEEVTGNGPVRLHFTSMNTAEKVLQTTVDKSPVTLMLNEVIAGFAKGVRGMHIGEKRRLYIHPDLTYRKMGPQSLPDVLIYEVEILEPY